ncbi:MAG: nucleotidyltransferase domain-containing protein [Firmicutes bacterium]|nr:nucleotidyltransferase domain-containing protein [Bacillota bacterium]
MDKARASTRQAIDRFIRVAEKKINIEKVILFGSYATGEVHEWSDIDIAVISSDFKDMDNRERLLLLNRIAWDAGVTEIDALGYTRQEFDSDDPLDLVTEIKEHCIVVYEKP